MQYHAIQAFAECPIPPPPPSNKKHSQLPSLVRTLVTWLRIPIPRVLLTIEMQKR